MKKLITSIILSTALIGGACAVAGCSNKTTGGKDNVSVADGIQTSAEFYTYGAASIGSIISAANAASTASVYAAVADLQPAEADQPADAPAQGETNPEPPTTNPEPPAPPTTNPEANPQLPTAELTDEQLATVNNYMALVENLLGNGNLSYVKSESDREGYEVKEEISYGDLDGNIITYTMYYNSVLDYVETEVDDDDDEKEADDEQETESGYSITGVMVVDGVDYALEGYSKTETEGVETESESYFKVTLAEGSYIIMEQEVEEDEKSLVYKVVEDRKVVEKTKFEYETERNETELKMSVEKNGSRTELRFSEEIERDKKVIKVTVIEGNQKTTFKIFVTKDENGNEIYRYTFGERVKDMHKNHRRGEHGEHDRHHD